MFKYMISVYILLKSLKMHVIKYSILDFQVGKFCCLLKAKCFQLHLHLGRKRGKCFTHLDMFSNLKQNQMFHVYIL